MHSLSLSLNLTASLYLFIMCAANDNRVRAHAALQPQYFANQSGSNSNEQNMPRHGATTSCKQIKETRIRPQDPQPTAPLSPLVDPHTNIDIDIDTKLRYGHKRYPTTHWSHCHRYWRPLGRGGKRRREKREG